MNTKEVCQLSDNEFKEIEDLFEKKLALENLAKIIKADNQSLYDKLISDYGSTVHKFNTWWETMGKKYNFIEKNLWVDFDTKKIMANIQ